MERQFFSGNTIEQAVMAAARHFGLDPSRVAYKPRDKKHGFLNIRRRVVIEVDPAAPEKPDVPPGERAEDAGAEPRMRADAGASGTEALEGRAFEGQESAFEEGAFEEDAIEEDAIEEDAIGEDAIGEDEDEVADDEREEDEAGLSGGGDELWSVGEAEDEDDEDRASDQRTARPAPSRGRSSGERSSGERSSGGRPSRRAESDEFADEIWRHRETLLAEFAEDSAAADKEVVAFEKVLDEVVELIEMELEATISREDGVIVVELEGEDGEFLVERDGLLLRAVEHLLPRLARGLLGYGLPCRVDCNGYQEARETEIREIAGGMAELARRQGKPQKLEPMSPADRRLVHLALADDPTVRTESEGSGYMKRVKVLPV